jgi:hypothetical protein
VWPCPVAFFLKSELSSDSVIGANPELTMKIDQENLLRK